MLTDDTRVMCVRSASTSGSAHSSRSTDGGNDHRTASGDIVVPCARDDIAAGRKIAVALLALTPKGTAWKLILVWTKATPNS